MAATGRARGWVAGLALSVLLAVPLASHAEDASVESAPDPQAPSQAGHLETSGTSGADGLALPGRWSVIVAAGDDKASNGAKTLAFDNARRAVADRLMAAGFDPSALREFSVNPGDFTEQTVKRASPFVLRKELAFIKNRSPDGCLFYLTTHGDEFGLVFGEDRLDPEGFWSLVERLCAEQPVVAVISACYSGIFAAEAWQRPNRFILTAARPDRTSFGCGEDDTMPYFDACFLDAAAEATSWADVSARARACVDARETAAELDPPSEPQLFIGAEVAPLTGAPG